MHLALYNNEIMSAYGPSRDHLETPLFFFFVSLILAIEATTSQMLSCDPDDGALTFFVGSDDFWPLVCSASADNKESISDIGW